MYHNALVRPRRAVCASISCFAVFAVLEDLVMAVDIREGMTCCCSMCQVYKYKPSPEAAAHCMCFNSLHWRCVYVCVCVLFVYTSYVPRACVCSYIHINRSKGNSVKCVFEMCLVRVCVCVWRTSSCRPLLQPLCMWEANCGQISVLIHTQGGSTS